MNSVERLDVHPRIITALKKGKFLVAHSPFLQDEYLLSSLIRATIAIFPSS